MRALTRRFAAALSLVSSGRGLARPPAIIAMAVLAVLASAAAALFLFDGGPNNQAEASGPSMAIQVFEDKEKTILVCDVGRKCDVTGGSSFSIDILASSPPAGSFSA